MRYPVIQITDDTTEQDIFDAVARHLITQGAHAERPRVVKNPAGRVVDERPVCVYRTDDGKACAVGCLLTDDEARQNETNLADDLQGIPWAVRFSGLLLALQRSHDTSPPSEWPARLRDVAAYYGLDTSVLGVQS